MKRPKRVRKWVVSGQKKEKDMLTGMYRYASKFCYYNKRLNYLAWVACSWDDVRIFDTEEDAKDFIDQKWMKYPSFVKGWKPAIKYIEQGTNK